MKQKAVGYLRVSTTRQGMNGLGMEAQRHAVKAFLSTGNWELLAEFAEVESGKRKDRPELEKAIALCRKTKATLVIAKLDRLARNAAFVLNLRDSGVAFVACDLPDANKFTIGIMALMAEQERDWISERTKAGLAAAKRNGVKLGTRKPKQAVKAMVQANQQRAKQFALKMQEPIAEIREAGVHTLKAIAECLNRRGYQTPRGRAWRRQSVANLLALIETSG